MSRLIVGPFNRVEGDLEVRLEVADGRVAGAQVVAPMYRGFEQMLPGRDPHDALIIVPRICGICSVSQSVVAARALADLQGIEPEANGLLVTNVMLACENLADHLAHFYLFFMPDFARPAYAGRPWFDEIVRRFEAQRGDHASAAIAARQRWFTVMGLLGGKWPHTHSIEPGGSSRAVSASERLRLLARVREFRLFVERTWLGAPLEAVAALDGVDALQAWHAQDPMRGDLRAFLTVAADLGLASLGPGPGRYLSYGAYPQPDGSMAVARGVWETAHDGPGHLVPLDPARITEDATHAWLADGGAPLHPAAGRTEPQPDKAGAYTWNKAPRLDGRVVETGAVARQVVDGHPLMRDAVARHGGSVLTRVLARAMEVARVLPRVEAWLHALVPGEPWCRASTAPRRDGHGMGLGEAARGALGHWLSVRDGRIERYQIVAPTSWNFSPRDAAGTPGALESALVGTPVQPGEATPVAVQHVVRSFDPCMVCTVH
ncbi:MAG: nickel-dependent hydrogenase large subunit [Rubrivivax sp.]|nr:nickel-dependent hydrogenase large subunit [Rubrivivax sp.]